MKLREDNPELWDEYYGKLKPLMVKAIKAQGIGALLELLADLFQEFGDTSEYPESDIWCNIASQLSTWEDKVKESS